MLVFFENFFWFDSGIGNFYLDFLEIIKNGSRVWPIFSALYGGPMGSEGCMGKKFSVGRYFFSNGPPC